MLEPEYRIGFSVLAGEIDLWPALKVALPAALRSLGRSYRVASDSEEPERKKTKIKDHLKLLALLYEELKKRYGAEKANHLISSVMMKGGQVFLRGFKPLGEGGELADFIGIYKNFERQNIVFDVIAETDSRFETVVSRCLIYEALNELGAGELTQWMCDVATRYFQSYHPKLGYEKDRMIARGDETCHEVFTWRG